MAAFQMTAPKAAYDPASGYEAEHRVICWGGRTEDELEDALPGSTRADRIRDESARRVGSFSKFCSEMRRV